MEETMRRIERQGETVIGGEQIRYRTCCEDYPVLAEDGALLGTMFVYSYLRTGVEKDGRPVLFAYNGGPGSSALWLHMGLLAPKRVRLDCPTKPPAIPPFEREVNPNCMLDICDIVVIDPMGTGYSRVFETGRQAEVYSVEQDAKVFACFIRDWIGREGRTNSPKYLLGESYGTLRSCVIPGVLMGGPLYAGAVSTGIAIDGILMLGTSLNVNPVPNVWDEYGIERMVLDLPTMAACCRYHYPEGKPGRKEFVEEAARFASAELLTGLYRGNRLAGDEERIFARKLTEFTGLSESYLRRKHYRVSLTEFSKELLADRGQEIGLYDGRFLMPSGSRIGLADPVADDGAMGRYTPVFRGAFAEQADELGISSEEPYTIINFNVNGMWKYDGVRTPLEYLRAALRRNPDLRVLIANGLYDLVTTIGQARYTANHLEAGKGQVILREYPSGHMAYVGEESGGLLGQDIRRFIRKEEMESCY